MASDRILVVDVGNSSISAGVAVGKRLSAVSRTRTADCTGKLVGSIVKELAAERGFTGAAICSVVPGLTPEWISAAGQLCESEPVEVNLKLKLGIDIDYPKPETIGADRLANSSGAAFRYGTPVIVADFGTALTFDIVSAAGAYVGGIIAPGLPLMTDYLAEKTALLPHIRLKGPHGAIGRSTVGAMRVGAKIGYRGMVREIVTYLEEQLGTTDVRLCATGGFARWALEGLAMPFVFEPKLTLYGLKRIWDLNIQEG